MEPRGHVFIDQYELLKGKQKTLMCWMRDVLLDKTQTWSFLYLFKYGEILSVIYTKLHIQKQMID